MPVGTGTGSTSTGGGGGGGSTGYPTRRAKFVTPGSSNPEALLATTATNGTQVVHNLTLSGSYARSLRISVMSGTIGNVTVSGINPAGGTHSEVVAADSSGFTLKVYGPGAVTVTIPNTASGSYRIGTWEWLGLTADEPAADMDDAGNGISIQTLANGAPQQTDGFVDVGVIRAPSIAGGYGSWRPSALGTFGLDGVTTFTVAYLGEPE